MQVFRQAVLRQKKKMYVVHDQKLKVNISSFFVSREF